MAKTKKATSKKQTRPAAHARAKKTAPKAAKPAARKGRLSWLDAKAEHPQIEQYARQLRSFMQALADGVVDESEVAAQEKRLVTLMKEIEPRLDDDLHGKVTRLLCELTAYDLMQVLHSMHAARPKTAFRG